MKIEQIRQVFEIFSTGSINRAAQNLYLAQSSLSSSLRSLERELGHSLFERSQSGISLTPFGQEFIAHGREILKHAEAIETYVAPRAEPQLRFSVSVYYLLFASRVFTQLRNRYKDQRGSFSYMEDTRSALIDNVAAGVSEIALLTMSVVKKSRWLNLMGECGLNYTPITTERPSVIVGMRSDLNRLRGGELACARLYDRPAIVFAESHPLFNAIDNEILSRLRPASRINVSDRGTLSAVLHQTDGIYLGTWNVRAYADGGFYEDVRHFGVSDADFDIEIGYIRRRCRELSPLASEYLEDICSLLSPVGTAPAQ